MTAASGLRTGRFAAVACGLEAGVAPRFFTFFAARAALEALRFRSRMACWMLRVLCSDGVAISNRFKGIKPAPAGIGYNFIDWYVDPGDVKY